MASLFHLGIALDGTGWHPGAWRLPDARPREVFTAGYWVDLVRAAEAGLADLVTIEDGLALQSGGYDTADDRTDRVRGRVDAVLVAARVAPVTRGVGLVPSITTTHTEPFHISKAIATLDYVSSGRGGVRVQVSGRAYEAELFGRRAFPPLGPQDLASPEAGSVLDELFDEAADHVEVVRRLWDSWEDDAEIRDAATGRFVDVDKLHYIDFAGRWFSVKGPSITPRPPQGQPVVAALAHTEEPIRLASRVADVVFVTPEGEPYGRGAADLVAAVRREQTTAGRGDETVHVFADAAVLLADSASQADARLAHLDELAGEHWVGADARLLAGTAADVADALLAWQADGVTGVRLRPAALPHDLTRIVADLVPELQRRGAFRTRYETSTLRGHLGLPRPANRYATV